MQGALPAAPPVLEPRPTLLCLGEMSPGLLELLRDVLGELSVEVRAPQVLSAKPSVVLVAVGRGEVRPLIDSARRAGGGAPVVALLPIQDARFAEAAFRAGADNCYALGTPLSRLRVVLARCVLSRSAEALRSLDAPPAPWEGSR